MKLFIIDEKWNEQPWFSTGGTRAKKYLQSPEGKFYYFKQSQYKEPTSTKPGKNFQYEFWSEIITYHVGILLGFNVLKYDIAVFGPVMGCICESMINSEQEELIEGVKYLQAFSPTYDPKDKDHKVRYTFQMIQNALELAKLKSEIDHILETIVLDALIGNGDRHQENWAIINKQILITDFFEKLQKDETRKFSKWEKIISTSLTNLVKRYRDAGMDKKIPKSFYSTERRFAPIYDNGSSLGRELLPEKIDLLLNSPDELNRYIDKGLAEIHWEGEKISHFKLIENILVLTAYTEKIKAIIHRVTKKWDGPEIARIIKDIDSLVPESHQINKIPDRRKELIFKIITLRRERLEALIK